MAALQLPALPRTPATSDPVLADLIEKFFSFVDLPLYLFGFLSLLITAIVQICLVTAIIVFCAQKAKLHKESKKFWLWIMPSFFTIIALYGFQVWGWGFFLKCLGLTIDTTSALAFSGHLFSSIEITTWAIPGQWSFLYFIIASSGLISLSITAASFTILLWLVAKFKI